MPEQAFERWTVWCEHADGRRYRMGDSSETRWSQATAEGIARYMAVHEAGTFTAELFPPPLPPPKYGIWRDDERCFVVDAYDKPLEFATRDEAVERVKEWNAEDAEDWVPQVGRGCYEARKLVQQEDA